MHRENNFPWPQLSHFRSRSRRQADDNTMGTFLINNDTLEFHIGFILDGVTTYRNLSTVLPQYSRQDVYRNPTLTAWSEEKVVRPGRETLEIEVNEHERFFL